MKQNVLFLLLAALLIGSLLVWHQLAPARYAQAPPHALPPGAKRLVLSYQEWDSRLTAEQYTITREGGTEWPNSSSLTHNHEPGLYRCVCCHAPLFSSATKFESGTGWPSFTTPIVPVAIYTQPDGNRTEVNCSICDAHLGHVFNDGPAPTGLRYCMNGAALQFTQKR